MHETCIDLVLGFKSDTSAVTYPISEFQIPWGDLDDVTSVVAEIIGYNADSVDRDVDILDGATPVATATIPAGTGSSTSLKRFEVSFTAGAGNKNYKVRLAGTTSVDQLGAWVRVRIRQGSAMTKTVSWFPLIGEFALTRAGTGGISTVTAAVYQQAAGAADKFTIFREQAAKFGGTVDMRLGVTGRKGSTGTTRSARYKLHTLGGTAVEDSLVEIGLGSGSTAFEFAESVDFSGDAQWSDATDYELLHAVNTFASGHNSQVGQAWIIVRVSDASAARSWIRVLTNVTATATDLSFWRAKYDASLFAAPAPAIVGVARESTAGDVQAVLSDYGTADGPGGSRTGTVGALDFGATKEYQEAACSPTDGNRYSGGSIRSDSSVLQIAVLLLAVDNETSQGIAASDALALVDQGPQGQLALGGGVSDGLSFGDSPAALLTPVSTEAASDGLSFGDSPPTGALFGALEAAASDALSFGDSPLTGAAAARSGPGITVLAKLALPGGDEWVSDVDVRHPSRFYQGRAQFGSIRRGAELPADLPQTADGSVMLADSDLRYRKLFGASSPKGRRIDIRLLPEGEREVAGQQVYQGTISRVRFPEGSVTLDYSDRTFSFFDDEIPALGTKDNFPLLLGDQEQFIPIIFGDVIGSEGLVECPMVDTSQFVFAWSRHPCEQLAAVWLKNRDADDFSPTTSYIPGSVSITDGGKTYEVQTIRVTAGGVDKDTKVRVEVRGLPDADGDAERNPAEGLKKYLLEIAGRASSELDLNAFAESAQRADDAGYLCDGVIARKINHREAVSRWAASFNLLVFQNKWGQIACKLPTVDEPDPLEVGELLSLRESVASELPDPAYNRIRYSFGRNYASGEWGVEQVYDNDPSQSVLGEVYETPYELWFVREAAVAEAVIQDVSGYWDSGAYRVELDLPAPEAAAEIEIGSQISLTHYSGVDPSGAGWAGRRFRVTDVEIAFGRGDYLRMKIRAVGKVAPPAEPVQGLLEVDWAENSVVGPYALGGGLFYGVFRDVDDDTLMNAWRSVDWGANWSKIPGPQVGSIASFDTFRSGSKILVATQEADGRTAFHRFDMPSNAWDVEDELVRAGWDPSDVTAQPFTSICARRASGQPFIFASGPLVEVDSVDRQRAFVTVRGAGGSWSPPQNIGSQPSYHYRGGRAVPGKEDLVHLFFERFPGDLTANTGDAYHQTYFGSGLGSAKRWKLTSLTWLPTTHNVGQYATRVNDDGGVTVYLPVKGGFGDASVYKFGSQQSLPGDDEGEITPDLRAIESTPFQGESVPNGVTRYPAIALGVTADGTIHAAWAAFVGGQRWEVYKSRNGNWDPRADGKLCSNTAGNRCSMEDRLGPKATVQKMNALFFDLGGRHWCARFSYTFFTTAQIAQLGLAGNAATVFELVDLARDVPRPASWTLQALADALTE